LSGARVPPKPVSQPIQPIIDRINWASPLINICSAVLYGEYVHFTVPLDDDILPRHRIIYNATTDSWESVDTWIDTELTIQRLLITNYQGSRRLFGVNYLFGRIYLMDEGIMDRTEVDRENWIRDTIETRGYGNSIGGGPGSFKSFRRMTVGLKTANPSVTITSIVDGAYEEKVLTPTPITKDPTQFYVWGHKSFNDTTDDPTEQKRKDYSLISLGYAAQDFESMDQGPILNLPPTDFQVDTTLTESMERRTIRQLGRWCALRIENTQGQCNVIGAGVDGIDSKNFVRVAA
jgi:hypothetical protein